LSRCQVYILKNLEKKELLQLLKKGSRVLTEQTGKQIVIQETEALLRISGGDARKLLNALELVANASLSPEKELIITDKLV